MASVTFRAITGHLYNQNPNAYLRERLEEMKTQYPRSKLSRAPKASLTAAPNLCPSSTSLACVFEDIDTDLSSSSNTTDSLEDHLNRSLLLEKEKNLALKLRLGEPKYRTNKKRILRACAKALKNGQDFKKTNAQRASKIHVNKASKLWSAFNRWGWLSLSYLKFIGIHEDESDYTTDSGWGSPPLNGDVFALE